MEDFLERAPFPRLHALVARGDLTAYRVQDRLEAGTVEYSAMCVCSDGCSGGGIECRHFQLAFRVGALRQVNLGIEAGKVRKYPL